MAVSGKAIFRWVLVAIAVLVVIGILLVWKLDKVVALGINNIGSRMTGTEVAVSDVSIGLFSGKIKLTGFRVDNPSGFDKPEALKVGKFACEVSLSTLTKPKTVIQSLELSDVYLNYEYRLSGSNLDVIQKNIEKQTGGKGDKPAKGDPAVSNKQLVIRKLMLRNINVVVSSKAVPSFTIMLPDLTLNDVGEQQNIAQLTDRILTVILTEIVKRVDLTKLGQSLQDVGRSTLDKIDKATDTVGGAVVQAGDSAGGAVNDALNRSRNLIRAIPGI